MSSCWAASQNPQAKKAAIDRASCPDRRTASSGFRSASVVRLHVKRKPAGCRAASVTRNLAWNPSAVRTRTRPANSSRIRLCFSNISWSRSSSRGSRPSLCSDATSTYTRAPRAAACERALTIWSSANRKLESWTVSRAASIRRTASDASDLPPSPCQIRPNCGSRDAARRPVSIQALGSTRERLSCTCVTLLLKLDVIRAPLQDPTGLGRASTSARLVVRCFHVALLPIARQSTSSHGGAGNVRQPPGSARRKRPATGSP